MPDIKLPTCEIHLIMGRLVSIWHNPQGCMVQVSCNDSDPMTVAYCVSSVHDF